MFVLAEGAAPLVHPGSADGVFSLLWLVIARKHRKGCASRQAISRGWCSTG